jgi:cysteine desulfurase
LHGRSGGTVTTVPVDRLGRVDPLTYGEVVTGRTDTALACLQAANHEVGTVQPVAEVAAACTDAGVPLLVDAAQALGRVAVPEGWSVLAASAHKWGGPAGVGVLAVRRSLRWRSPLPEDERGGGRVPGFEDVPGALAAAAALRARVEESAELAARHSMLVDRIRARVPELVPDVEVLGDPEWRLPHLVTFSCLYVDGEALVTELDRAGFAVSSGSSCTASTLEPSHVLAAMGVLTHGNVRVSLTRDTSEADVERFLGVLPGVVARIRSLSGVEGL